MRCFTRSLVAGALLVVVGCTGEDPSATDPIDLNGSGESGPGGARPASSTPGNTSSSATSTSPPAVTTPTTTPAERERARAEAAVDEALQALGRQPAVTYSSRLTGFGPQPKRRNRERPEVDAGSMRVVATASGLVHGGGSVRGESVELLAMDAKLYLRMGPSQWRRLGIDDTTSNRFAFGWTVTSPEDVGFDPRRALRPQALAERLAVPARGELSYRIVRRRDGGRVYRVDVRRGTIDVTVRAPHRVSTTTVPLWSELPTGGVSGNLNFARKAVTILTEPTADEIVYTREVLKDQRRGLASSLLLAPSLRIRVPDVATLDCTQFGECTIRARVTNRVEREFVRVTSVEVLMQGFLRAGRLGAERCSTPVLMAVDSAARMSCSVEFDVPSDGRSYEITGRVLATGFARWEADPAVMLAQIRRHATETLRALADE